MRKRSMSVYAARDNDQLSKKFEGVASDNDANYESEDETKDDEVLSEEWTKPDYDSLVAQLKETLPKRDIRKWQTSLHAVNWDQIKVRQHTTQNVEKVARQLIGKVRTFRTFGEILEDVPEVVTKLLSAERPKPPLTAYSLFVKEMLPKLREDNKEMRVQHIFKLIPKLFQELTIKKRRRYEEAAARLKEEYQVNLAKFYEDHPDMMPKKTRKEPLKTPFQLFYQSRRASSSISCQQARKEWEDLPLKKKVKFIQSSFDAQADTDSKLVNKKEMEMLDHSLGKPDFVGRNAYEFFRRKLRAQYTTTSGTARDVQIRMEYKKLNAEELSKLKDEFLEARAAYVYSYQQYIKKLPAEKQQAEIDFLKTISDKTPTKEKTDKKKAKAKALKEEIHSTGSADEDLPVAESTTINKKLLTGKKAIAEESAEESGSSDRRSSQKKQPKISKATAPPSPIKAPALLSITKSEAPASSASSSDEEEPSKQQVSTSRKSVPTSPSKNGSALKVSDTKKRTSSEVIKTEVEVKKSKKSVAKEIANVKPTEEPDTPPAPAIKATKAAKSMETPSQKAKEPEKPPKDVQEFYRQRFYKGKPGKHLESYANLSIAKKREIGDQLKIAQKQYIVDFENFLKSMPKDQIRKYIQKVNAQKQPQSSDDDSDDDDDDDAESDNSSEEVEDDE